MHKLNWTVGKKLALAFSFLLIFLVGVALFSFWQINLLQASSESLANDSLRKLTLAQQAQRAARSQVAALYSLFLLNQREERVPVYPVFDRNGELLSTSLKDLSKVPSSAEEMKLFASVLDARSLFDKSVTTTFDEIELDIPSAKSLMVNETEPLLGHLVQRLDDLVALQDTRVKAQIASNRETGQLAKRMILMIGVLAGVVAAISVWAITRSIVRPLNYAVQFADEIAQGKLDSSLPLKGQGELKTLLDALTRMREGIDAREKRIGVLAYFDPLTGLPNRAKFHQNLRDLLAAGGTQATPVGVMFMNLNRFKNVNDALGYEAGDALLKEVGWRVKATLAKSGGMVARQQADEFIILLPDCDAERAVRVASDILGGMSHPIYVGGQPVDVEASIGIALSPEHGLEPERLLLCADQAMHAAKRVNAGALTYDPTHALGIQDNLSLYSEIRHAVENNELVLYFQPQLCLKTNAILRAEVLVRWLHPQRGVIPPDSFIPFAEQTGAIRKISRWVLKHACMQLATWSAAEPALGLCVNLSARDLTDPAFPQYIDDLLNEFAIDRHLLCLEVTESAAMEDPVQGLHALEKLRKLGMRLSIDDFGTGYSSLSYLKRLPVEEIKIDKSFVLQLDVDDDDDKIVRSTIDLSHIMELEVIAEGVETQASLDRLRNYGCDFAQGYFIARPMPKALFEDWLVQRRQGNIT